MVNTMHRLKILQIGYLDPFNNFGGVEKYILDLTSTLSENFGCEVDILCSGNKSTIKKTPFGKLIIISVPNFNVPLYRNLRQIIYSFRAMRYIEKIKQDYDSIHYHGDNGFISSKVGNAVLTLHGLSGPFISKVLDPKQILGLFSFFIELFNVKRAVSVFSISEPVTKFIRELTSITPLDVPQAIKPNLYKDANNKLDLRIELGIDPRAFVGIIIGREPKRKGLDIAVEAFKIINDKRYKLLVIGFPGYQVNSDYVRYLGDVEEEYKVKCIKASDFLIMPSKKEGFPIVSIEACFANIGIIASKNSNTSSIANMARFYRELDTNDPHKYSECIVDFSNEDLDHGNLEEVTEKLNQHTFEYVGAKYLKAYQQINQ